MKKTQFLIGAMFLAGTLFTACKKDKDKDKSPEQTITCPSEFTDQLLKAKINGEDYDFQLGKENESSDDYISASFFVGTNNGQNLCDMMTYASSVTPQILSLTLPNSTGTHSLGEMLDEEHATAVGLMNGDEGSYISVCGSIRIDTLTADRIVGEVVAENFGENSDLSNDLYRADGKFVIQRCD